MRLAVMALMFFPRGGSAHTARELARALPAQGWSVRLVSGSRRDAGQGGDALHFYRGLDTSAVDYTAALRHPDPVRFDGESEDEPPMHPSYEDRPEAPDVVFATLDDADFKRQVGAWGGALERAGAPSADILHLHHLTPMNEAAARVAPDVPVIGQLHGTELLMLERIEAGAPASWVHAETWAQRMRDWAARCRRLLVAPGGLERAAGLLGVPPARLVAVPNGADPDRFRPQPIDRLAHWRHHLVDEPQGWLPGRGPGSVSYAEGDVREFEHGVVLTYVGRFSEVKRLPLLVEAHAKARPRFSRPAPLVLIGGHPGEWEGEHPAEAIASSGAEDVFLAGWHDHDALPDFLAASDVVVFPSVREQFGQVLVEGMACGLPAVAARSFGAESIVEDGRTGWLVPPDDVDALADALVEAVNDDAERRRRGDEARKEALEKYSWPAIAERVAALYESESQGTDRAQGRSTGGNEG